MFMLPEVVVPDAIRSVGQEQVMSLNLKITHGMKITQIK
jgi:hypothetical protein